MRHNNTVKHTMTVAGDWGLLQQISADVFGMTHNRQKKMVDAHAFDCAASKTHSL